MSSKKHRIGWRTILADTEVLSRYTVQLNRHRTTELGAVLTLLCSNSRQWKGRQVAQLRYLSTLALLVRQRLRWRHVGGGLLDWEERLCYWSIHLVALKILRCHDCVRLASLLRGRDLRLAFGRLGCAPRLSCTVCRQSLPLPPRIGRIGCLCKLALGKILMLCVGKPCRAPHLRGLLRYRGWRRALLCRSSAAMIC